jgi:hypothetical protein
MEGWARPSYTVGPALARLFRTNSARQVPSSHRTLGSCLTCHTRLQDGQPTPGIHFAGGEEFRTPAGVVVSANITPDPETGIGHWSEEFFIGKFYQYRAYVEKGSPGVGRAYFTLMPWLGLSQLSRGELGAIYAYLRIQPPVINKVETCPEW